MSPTKSLIDDLLLQCGTLEIPACKFTADVPKDAQDIQLLHLKNYKKILTTPEMLSKDNDFYRKIVQVSDADQLDRIVVVCLSTYCCDLGRYFPSTLSERL